MEMEFCLTASKADTKECMADCQPVLPLPKIAGSTGKGEIIQCFYATLAERYNRIDLKAQCEDSFWRMAVFATVCGSFGDSFIGSRHGNYWSLD